MIAAWDAKLYDGKHSFLWEKGKGVVELLAPQPGERILDLGCGTGHLTAEIAASGADTVGIDQSADMIAQARRQFPNLRFEVCDAREIPFTGEFDAVFSNAALHWIPEAGRVIESVARALKPGGRFVTYTADAPPLLSLGGISGRAFDAVMKLRNIVLKPPFVMYYSTLRLPQLLNTLEAERFIAQIHPTPFPRLHLIVASRANTK